MTKNSILTFTDKLNEINMTLSNIRLSGFTSSSAQGFKILSSKLVGPLADLNNDGIDDFGVVVNGVLTCVWGRNGGFNTDLNINAITIPDQGIKITSSQISGQILTNSNYYVGTSFASSDLNNDGNLDIVIVNGGKDAFLVWGSGSNMTANIDLNTPSSAFVKIVSPASGFGNSLAILDFDKNGWSDLFLSSPTQGATRKGIVYGLLNQLGAFNNSSNITITALSTTSIPKVITISGDSDYNEVGTILANLDDVTNDGFPDLGVGAPLATFQGFHSGEVFLIKGTSTPTNINLATLSLSQGSLIKGSQDGSRFGFSITSLQDFNNDGIKDFAVGSYQASPYNSRGDSGEVFIFYGLNGGLPNIDLSSSTLPTNVKYLVGEIVDQQAGTSLGLIKNPNGTPIMLIGSPMQQYINNNAGAVKLLVGANGTYSSMDLYNLADPYGFTIYGLTGDHLGIAVGCLGYISNGTYPSYFVVSQSNTYALNGFNATSPVIKPAVAPTTVSSSSSSTGAATALSSSWATGTAAASSSSSSTGTSNSAAYDASEGVEFLITALISATTYYLYDFV